MESNTNDNDVANTGIAIVLARMDTHPEEFYGNSEKWKFIYHEYFRDAMTETEKGMIFDKMKKLRRAELTDRVMSVMVKGMEIDKVKDAGLKSFPQPAVLAGYHSPNAPLTDAEIEEFTSTFKKPV